MKGIAEVGQLGRGYLHCKSRRNVKAKCRHALEEKCIVAREQNSEGPWALGSRPCDGSSSGKVQLPLTVGGAVPPCVGLSSTL